MTRFTTSALTALLLVTPTSAQLGKASRRLGATNPEQDLEAREHPDSRNLALGGSNVNPFGSSFSRGSINSMSSLNSMSGSSSGTSFRGFSSARTSGTGTIGSVSGGSQFGQINGGPSSDSSDDEHFCTATITFQDTQTTIQVKNTNTVATVERMIEDEFGGVDVPTLTKFFSGRGDEKCLADSRLADCGICEHANTAITIEISGNDQDGWSCSLQSQTQFSGSSTTRTQSLLDGSGLGLNSQFGTLNINNGGPLSGRQGFTGIGSRSGSGVTNIRHSGRVRVRYGESIITLSDIYTDDTLFTIKKRLESETGLTANNMHLSYNGAEMSENHKRITDDFGYDLTKQPQDLLVLRNVEEERSKSFNGGAKGDPHFVMWNGRKFDFHGGCDLVLVDDPTFDNGAGIKIHVRTKVLRWFSFVDSVVVQIGKDTLEVAGGFERRRYWVNGEQGDYVQVNGPMPFTIGGKQVRFQVMRNNISFQFKIVLDQKKKEEIILRAVKDYMRIDLSHPRKDLFANSVGLMGGFSDMEDNMLARDGATIMEDVNEFSMEWQVRDTEPMLFHNVEGPQYPQACEMPSEDRAERRRLSSSVNRDEAEAACSKVDKSERDSCVMDVIATGDLDLADAY